MSATTVKRTAFSLLLLAGVSGDAVAQQGPATTEWKLPVPVLTAPPIRQLTPLTPPPAPVVMPPSGGQMTFQKLAGDDRPAAQQTVPFTGTLTRFPQAKPDDKKDDKKDEAGPAPAEKSQGVKEKGSDRPAPALPTRPGGLPIREDVFRFDNDATLNARILKDLGKKPDEKFPTITPIAPPGAMYIPKTGQYAATQATLVPSYVVHRRLYFEEVNAERYGWDAGPIQPVFSSMYFYRDCLMWPHNLASGLFRERYETSAGKCLPGSPVPYTLYPPALTLSGTMTEAVIVTGAAIILP